MSEPEQTQVERKQQYWQQHDVLPINKQLRLERAAIHVIFSMIRQQSTCVYFDTYRPMAVEQDLD